MKDNRFDNYLTSHFSSIYKGNIGKSYRSRYYLWKSVLLKYLPSDKQTTILEVGCGMGHNLYSLKILGYKNVTGIDISGECVKYCLKNGFHVFQSSSVDAFASTVNNTKFKLIILYDVLEHYKTTDAIQLLSSISMLFKEKGQILISVPNAAYPLNLNLFYSDITHNFIYNEISLDQVLSNSGLKSIKYIYSNSFTLYDDIFLKKLFKNFVLKPISLIGETFWKIIALSQGVILKNVKPTLFCIAEKS